MAKFTPTKDQQRAIEARGSALLVSAAAGSGKTKVLTERLMSYITSDNPVGIDTFLVITYTRAAAGELRGRILEELTNRMAEQPNNAALRRQYALMSRAQISTIHGFCSALIRENCLPLELPPDFKVVDETRTAVMKQAALDKTLEACYERLDTDAGLRELIDTVGAGRDDGRLGALILNLHAKMQSHPYPAVWAENQRKALYAEGITDPGDTIWGRFLLDSAAETAEYWAATLERNMQILTKPAYTDICGKIYPNLEETAESYRNFAAAARLGWDKAAENAHFVYSRWSAPRKTEHGELLKQIKAQRDASKKAMEKVAGEFTQNGKEVLADMRRTAPAMDALLRLTLEFDRAFAADKKRRGFVDYSDLEHFAAKLLSDEQGNPTDLARQISQRYTEIMVDEYQDVNEVQELIFRCVSKNETNLFTVGDVKQSIYRFRLADPTIFTNKYLTYADYEAAEAGQPRRILLQENFRSRSQILEGANAVFENIMSTHLGELEYDDNARLRCGNKSYEGDVPVPQIHLVESEKGDDEDATTTSHEVEADYVAELISELIENEMPVTQDGVQRPVRYGDIVLLMRSANTVSGIYRKALTDHGIPVQSEQGGGFYTTPEITVMMALLAVVDNPMQDVPLITALQSVYVGFTPDELAQVRACDKKACFYDALCIAAGQLPKAEAFLRKLDAWRAVSADIPLRELIWRILDDLSVTAVTSAMTDGQVRRRNLMAFAELAAQFEAGGYQGLRRFVVWLNRQAESGMEPELYSGEGGNAVQIMSIHKSKGLEFPVVFLCDTARKFNKKDSMDTVLVHPQMGLGPKVIDSERGIEYYSMPRRALIRKMNRETLSEEMRLLYVAMTRAKEYLYVTGVLGNGAKKLDDLRSLVTRPVSPQVLEGAAAPIDWLIAAALADGERHLTVHVQPWWPGGIMTEKQEEEKPAVSAAADESLVETLRKNLAYQYPYARSVDLPSKLTATELKHLRDADEEAVSMVGSTPRKFRSFRTDGAAEALNAVEKGVATHLVFQHIDYHKAIDLPSVEQEIARLEAKGILNSRQAKGVDARQVAQFFLSPAGELMRTGDAVLREFKFSLLRPASAYFAGVDEDEILLQGVIDCAVEKDGAYTIIDYKTDAVTQASVQARAALYASQVQAYREAMEEITGKPVAKTILYFLKPGISVEI